MSQVCPIRVGLVTAEEVPMNLSNIIRQVHRWLGVVFTISVIATFVAMAQEKPAVWVSYLPLAPLALLWLTGVYLFVLPHAAKWRRGLHTD
jgi:hypothetical protein